MKIIRVLLTLIVVIMITAPTFAAEVDNKGSYNAKLTFGENMWLGLHYLMQVRADFSEVAGSGDAWNKDFYLKRSRIILKGEITEYISFFMETEGNASGSTFNFFTQDAFITFKIIEEFKISTGLLIPAFTHHGIQSAVSLLGLDYNIPTVSNYQATNGKVWRDFGITFHGLVGKGIFEYRVGIYEGTDQSPDIPRITGRFQINIFDPETGFFYSGNYLGKKKILSFGAGFDWQQDPVAGSSTDHFGTTADINFQMFNVISQAAFTYIINSPNTNNDGSYSYFIQAGYLIINRILPYAKYWATYTEQTDTTQSAVMAGCGYYFKGHNANVKAEFSYPLMDSQNMAVNIQAQIFL